MTISPHQFVRDMRDAGIGMVTGVPDSLLKEFCSALAMSDLQQQHITAPNEGAATALAMGHYLAQRKPALVYMQNSGLGNAINPITSLACQSIYAIPMALLIGWRGEIDPNGEQVNDEPQHRMQGAITIEQLALLDIPFQVIDGKSDSKATLNWAVQTALTQCRPVALVVRKGSFAEAQAAPMRTEAFSLRREQALECLLQHAPADSPLVVTTGMASREVFEIRTRRQQTHGSDFLVVGGMGHALMIATGIARSMPERKVLCIDGDGALLMHTGALSISGAQTNLVHIVLNNAAHDSVGGQPTSYGDLPLSPVAQAFGYGSVLTVDNERSLADALAGSLATPRSAFIEVMCRRGNRPDLGRPNSTPIENRDAFMRFLNAE
jgi:phosphonopyruvate decarboxylase